MVERKVKKWLQKKKRKRNEELLAFEKMSLSNSEQKSMSSNSSKEDGNLKIGTGKLFKIIWNHTDKKIKQHKALQAA